MALVVNHMVLVGLRTLCYSSGNVVKKLVFIKAEHLTPKSLLIFTLGLRYILWLKR